MTKIMLIEKQSLQSSDKFVHWEIIPFQIIYNLSVKCIWHNWLSVQYPKESIIRTTDNRIGIIFSQSHYPVLCSDVQSLQELDFQLSICFVFRDGFSHSSMLFPISDTFVVNFDGFVSIQGIIGNCVRTTSFKVVRDCCLFIPYTQVTLNIHIGNCLGLLTNTEIGLGEHIQRF